MSSSFHRWLRSVPAVLALALCALTGSAGAAAPDGPACNLTTVRAYEAGTVATDGALDRPVKRFPVDVAADQHPDWFVQGGFESEYAISESGQLFQVYGPAPGTFGADQWDGLSPQERVAFVQANKQRIFPRGPGEGALVKRDAAANAALPERLVLDETGNVEIVVAPQDSLEALWKIVLYCAERFGVGSMQATSSSAREWFYGQGPGSSLDANAGFFRFIQDHDTLAKMHLGYLKMRRDATRPVLLSFTHQWLGPLTAQRQRKTEEYLRQGAQGQQFNQYELSQIKGRDSSLKYFGSTVLRPDIAGTTRAVVEIRDAHKSLEILRQRVVRANFHMTHDRSAFLAARNLVAFDIEADFDKLPAAAQQALLQIFPTKEQPGVPYLQEDRTALQVGRNFALPLKDWGEHLRLLNEPDLGRTVPAAQAAYRTALLDATERFTAGGLERAQASVAIQNAASTFAHDSGLYDAMTRWYDTHVRATPAYAAYLRSLPPELARATNAGGG
jgi:hypothetical protein